MGINYAGGGFLLSFSVLFHFFSFICFVFFFTFFLILFLASFFLFLSSFVVVFLIYVLFFSLSLSLSHTTKSKGKQADTKYWRGSVKKNAGVQNRKVERVKEKIDKKNKN